MDAISDNEVESVVVIKSAQVGWTEILNNVCGYHIAQDAAPILVVQPTVEMGEAWSKDRLAPMLRDTPQLRGLVSDPKSRDGSNTTTHKVFPGGHLTVAGANSAASLASRPIRMVLLDEVDRYPASAGSEGDPITLARKRTSTFWNRKILMGSTPTISGVSRIEFAYEGSDRRRYHVPCPDCGVLQSLKWPQVQWTDGDASSARYHCEGCGVAWTDAQRWAAVRRGKWVAEAEFKGIAGFHINELASPWRRLSETVAEFLAAKTRPELLKVFVNTALGETWRERGDAPEWERLFERREPYDMGAVPAGASVLTVGVDAQGDRLELTVWAWAKGLERWMVDTRILPGSPRENGPWDELQELMNRDWPCEAGGTMRVSMACCDTGGQDTAAIYGQIRRLGDRRIVGIKGIDGWNKASPVTGPTAVDALVDGRKLKRGLRIYTIAVSTFKAELYQSLNLKRVDDGFPAGWVHLPQGADPEWIKQLTAEELRTIKDRRGFTRQEWAALRPRNEALDCAVYARAALWLAGADRQGTRFWGKAGAVKTVAPVAVVTPAVVPPPHVVKPPAVQRRAGYFGGWR